jgi:hypothetical protein
LGLRLRVFPLEDNGQFGDGLLFPPGHGVVIKLMFGGDLSNRLGFFECFQGDLSLESGTKLFSHGRWYPP